MAKSAPTPTPAPSNKLAIYGSTTLLPIAQKAVEEFQKRKPEIKISLTGGGSLSGINALVDGYADVAMSSREMKKEEKEKMQQKRGIPAKETIVAWDGIIPIVHPSNPVKNLTIAQLKDIYTGKVTDWEQVGGKKGAIVVVSRDFTSGTHEAWAELVLNNEPVVASTQEKSSSSSILETVASTPNAIGYDGLGYVEGNSRVKRVSVDGQAASANSILDRSYKIARPLYLFTRDNPNATVAEFLSFIVSPEGQALIREAKFVPLSQRP
jgi:phosphate transport system substrate-binding protein